jgi:uncharacterized membrane protein YsdA (DUF1294 family)
MIIINTASEIVFLFDKRATIKNRRVPEKTLNILEIPGGLFVNFY